MIVSKRITFLSWGISVLPWRISVLSVYRRGLSILLIRINSISRCHFSDNFFRLGRCSILTHQRWFSGLTNHIFISSNYVCFRSSCLRRRAICIYNWFNWTVKRSHWRVISRNWIRIIFRHLIRIVSTAIIHISCNKIGWFLRWASSK